MGVLIVEGWSDAGRNRTKRRRLIALRKVCLVNKMALPTISNFSHFGQPNRGSCCGAHMQNSQWRSACTAFIQRNRWSLILPLLHQKTIELIRKKLPVALAEWRRSAG